MVWIIYLVLVIRAVTQGADYKLVHLVVRHSVNLDFL